MTEFARRNLALPAGLAPRKVERQAREASHRFRVCWETLEMTCRLFPSRGRLLALYLDGSQHHRRQLAPAPQRARHRLFRQRIGQAVTPVTLPQRGQRYWPDDAVVPAHGRALCANPRTPKKGNGGPA